MKIHIPKILIYSRLIFAVLILGLSFVSSFDSEYFVLLIIYVGILTDVFDGILARKLNISTNILRVQDTLVDMLFYISILYYIVKSNPERFSEHIIFILAILLLEFFMYVISLARFQKLPSPHAILSKFWGIYLVFEFTLLLLNIQGNHFSIALYIGLFVHIDRVLIYIILRKWEHDIPSCIHAYKLRQGKEIKRIKLFNG